MRLYSSSSVILFILIVVSRFGYIRLSSIFIDEDEIVAAYEDVRNDATVTNWAALTYEGKQVKLAATGVDYSELLPHMTDDARVYAYLRIETGDEMSRRAKFAFITWIGPSVSPLKKAKVSTDKAFVKKLWPGAIFQPSNNVMCKKHTKKENFGKEILADEKADLKYEKIKSTLEKASGAAYGTGK